ncbi:LOW QUALITY PROTEIN: breast cancer type 2 susceptibility protein [Erpetoichthys calabaricus]|uniref:LOW QUALITY PROTEIN: breast cancer type 2 susceptibility protein n=1 Tax=Erpetoichthys calabaricus TaxID=27687 RepID=UPI002234DA28|nr:LOW QUALITY PROTEIN: breast cancer type 2 susceptibility protein [Erpetoichthys calabaricus]
MQRESFFKCSDGCEILRLRNTFEIFKTRCAPDLEELNLNWFEELTAKASSENNNDHYDTNSRDHSNHAEYPRTAWKQQQFLESQFLSTPNIFKGQEGLSPKISTPDLTNTHFETGSKQNARTAFMESSPVVFQNVNKKTHHVNNLGTFEDLLQTPNLSKIGSTNHISESLGAVIDPDMSWSSSLNTPRTVTPTVLVSKWHSDFDQQCHPEEKPSMLVRRLFSNKQSKNVNGELATHVSPKHHKVQTLETEDCGAKAESEENNHACSAWKQTLPSSVDNEALNTVAKVLEGAEDVLSFFFSSTSSRRGVEQNTSHKILSAKVSENFKIPHKDTNFSGVGNVDSSLYNEFLNQPGEEAKWKNSPKTDLVKNGTGHSNCLANSKEKEIDQNEEGLSRYKSDTLTVEHLGYSPTDLLLLNIHMPDLTCTPEIGNESTSISLKKIEKHVALSKEPRYSPSPKEKRSTMRNETKECFEPVHLTDLNPRQDELWLRSSSFTPQECRVDCCGTNPVIVHNNQKQNDSFLAPDTSCQNITVSSDFMEKYPVMTDKLKDSKELPPYASEQSATNHTTDIVPSIDVCVLPHKKTMSRTAQFCKAKLSRSESEEYLEGRLSSDSDHKSKKKRKNSEEGYCSSSEESYLKKVIPDDKLSNHTYKESSECLATAPSKIPSFTDSLHDTGFKTASNNTIKVYSASFDKAQSMFEETEDLYLKDQHLQKSSLCLKRCSEKEFSKSFSEADKMWCSSKLPSSNNVFLTPSQKAEVYELCSFLEEAGTQFELTQTEKTKSKSNNCNSLHSTGDQETIPSTPNVSDILNGINFDDSFNAENNTSLNAKPAMDLMMTIDSHEESCEKVCTSIQSAKTVNSLYLGKKGNDLSFSAQGKEPNGGSDVEKGVNTSTQDSVGAVTHLEGIDFHKRLLKEGEMNTETENERHIIKQQLMCPSPAENGDIASYTMVRESSNYTESREMKENNVIKGFYTASGKKLNISKNAMESATSIFEDLCPEKNWTCSYLSKSLNTSDTSESQPAKHFSVPRKVVNKSFKEVSQTNKNECKPSYFPGVTVCIQNETQLNPNLAFSSNKDHSENKDQSSSVGFMSANKSFKNSNNKFMSVQGLCGLESFQTASGNVITYGQESLAKGLTLFSEEDDFSPYDDKKCSDKCDFQFENEHNSADTGIHVSKGDFGNLMDVSSSCLVSHCHKRKTDSNLPKLNDDASKRAKEMFKDSGNLNDELLTDVCLIVADGVKHHCTKPRLNDSLSSEVGELGNVQCPVSKRNFDITQVNLLNTSNNGRDGPNVSLPIDMVIFSSENRKSLQHMNSKYGTCDMTLSCGLLCNKSLIQDDLPMQHDSFVSDNSDSDGNKVGVSCVGLGTEHNVSYQKPYMLDENYTYEDSTKRANNIVTDTTAHCENFQTTAFCKNGNQNLTSEQVLKKKGTFSNIDKTLAPSVSAVSTTSRFLLDSDSEKKVCFSKTVFCEEEALLRGPDEANRIKKDIRCDAENMKQSGMPHSKCARNVAGFSTANGKTIFFSEEAFCKAKALLNDCEDRNSQICATEVMKAPHLPLENCAKNVVGFSTTSRKNIFISEKSFSDAKTLLKNCENKKLEESKSFDMVKMKVPCPPVVNYKPESAAGFNTASGKRITITEKALEDTKALFNNCDEETNDRMISSGSESTESPGLLFKNCVPSSASGFTTASGKRVQFSEKAFSEATALLKDCVDTTSEKSASSDSESLHHLVNHYTKNIQRLNVARGKMLSEKASDDTKTLLNYSKDETNEKKSISDFENTKVPDLYPPSCNSRNFARVGPSTNKRTLFSEKALHHSKKSLKDGEDERKKNISKSGNGLIKSKLLFADCTKNNTGFPTVSGNKFVISESALHDSKALLNEYVNEVTEEHTNSDMVHQQAPILPHVNCITESGKKVLITEKALHDAEVFFKDCDSERNEKMIGSGAEFSKVPGFSHVNSGFRTASGKNVLFSEKALCDAKVLLSSCENDINTIISTDAKNMKVPDLSILDYSNKNVTEFSIARENNVFSSKKAFCDAKTSFDNNCGKETYEKNATINDEQMKDFGPPLLGFSTASGKTVLFSEKAYEEAKEILREASDYVPALLKARTRSLHPEQMNNIVGINQEIKADSFDCNESYSRFCTPALQGRANNEKNNSTDMTMTGTHFEHELKSVPSQPSMTNDKTLNLHVDSFGECTETQQRFIEQEALECTKALINDENVESLLNQNRNPPENRKESFCTGRMRYRNENSDRECGIKDEGSKSIHDGVFIPLFRCKKPYSGTVSDASQQKLSTEKTNSTNNESSGYILPLCKPSRYDSYKNNKVQSSSAVPETFTSVDKVKETPCKDDNVEESAQMEKSRCLESTDISNKYQVSATHLNIDWEENLANLSCARDMQDMRIRKKKRQNVKPQPGHLFLSKTSLTSKISFLSFVNNQLPRFYSPQQLYTFGVRRPTIHAYYKYAASFRFKFTDYFSKDAVLTSHGAQLADGGWLISDDSGTAGKEEFYRALCDTPGVDPKLITENWVYNHYSLIIWKLAAMETAFPNVFGGCCLTPERVLLQLKYRYDVEIDRCQRSAIKKITERDDSPAKTLILCISKIIANGSQPYPNIKNNTSTTSADKKKQLPTGVIEVTDGWYLIKAHLDARLTALLQSGKLSVGNKIVTNGAELIGCQDACTPLEAPESLMLKISANSTRPARWYCKLGFYCDPRPFVLPLSSLFYDGGIVGCVDVIILRSYSLQWMEKRPNGVFLFRNERAEVREAKRQEDSHQKNMEELFARVQAEFEKDLELKNKSKGKSKVKLNIQQIQALQDGAELYEAFESSTDPGFLETCLSAQQVAVLNRHKQAVNDQKQAKLQEKFRKILESSQEENSCTKRDVTPVWKLHIVDYKDLDASKVYMLNVWRPTVDLCSLLKEGDRYKIYHLAASQPKGRMGSTSVQLTVTKKTQFQQLQAAPDHLTFLYKCREAVNFRSLSNPTFQPPCEEVDLVGLVICIEGKQGGAAVVYLCDEELNFVALKTWSSLNHLAADDIIMPMTLLAASNLHFKYNSSVAIPVVYGGDLATFSGNPKEKHLHSAIEHLKKNIQNIQDFCKEAEKKLNKLKANTAGFLQSRECYTHSKQNMDKTNQIPLIFSENNFQMAHCTIQQAVTPAKRKAVEDEESDRKSIKKKKALDFLSRIPSPPPLTPLKNIVSDSLKKGFHPPRKQTFTPETRKEETSDKSQAVLCNKPVSSNHFPEDQWVNDEELAMINTQALLGCLQEDVKNSST